MPSLQPCSRGELVERLDIHVADVDHFLFGDVLHFFVASRQALGRGFDAFAQLLGIEAADRVLHDDKLGLDLAGFRLGKNQRLEGLSGDHVGRDAELLEFDAVVETPR